MGARPSNQPQTLFRFGIFELDTDGAELRKAGRRIHLRPQAFRVLMALAKRPGQIVTREELKNEIWGSDTFVDFEHGLNLCIRQIRSALADDADTPRYIETFPRRGYRFIARIQPLAPEGGAIDAHLSGGVSTPHEAGRSGIHKTLGSGSWALTALVVAVLVGGAALVAFRALPALHSRSPEPLKITSIVVLPLENLSRDPDQEYFADGMTDELTTDLAKIHALRVISRNSAMQYKGKHKPVQQIARELNVDAVVEGTVMRSGDRVRITAQLIAAGQDRHLWADTYERDLRDVLALQDEVTRSIAQQVSIQLTPQERAQFGNARAVNPEAHQDYLRGLYELRSHTLEGNAKAIEHFQRALEIDPRDALAYEGLALAYTGSPDAVPKTVMPKAKAAALEAIDLDDSLAEAHSSLGYVKLVFDWDWVGAEQELRRALDLNPNSPLAHTHYGRYLLLVPHRVDEAVQNFQQAYDLDPAVPEEFDDLVGLLYFARRYQTAIDEAAKELEDNSPFLALAYAELGRRNEALAVASRAAYSARGPSEMAQAASAYALAGDRQRANALLGQIVAQANQHYLCGMNVAAVYSTLGDKDRAMVWLEKGYRDRSV